MNVTTSGEIIVIIKSLTVRFSVSLLSYISVSEGHFVFWKVEVIIYLDPVLRFSTLKTSVIVCSVSKCTRIKGWFFLKVAFYTKKQMIFFFLKYVSCTQISKC